jgi:hypothetical protein
MLETFSSASTVNLPTFARSHFSFFVLTELGIFVDEVGTKTRDFTMKWTAPPTSLGSLETELEAHQSLIIGSSSSFWKNEKCTAYSFPYILAFTSPLIEVRSLINGKLLHTIQLPSIRMLTSKGGVFIATSSKGMDHVYQITQGESFASESLGSEVAQLSFSFLFLFPFFLVSSKRKVAVFKIVGVVKPASIAQLNSGHSH